MKLTKGLKSTSLNIPKGISYKLTISNGYTEIEITDLTQITKLKSMGFK